MSAQVILVSAGGGSLADPATEVTAKTLAGLIPDEQTKTEARSALERLGFTVYDAGPSLTIEGEPEVFERVFGAPVEVPPELRGLVDAVAYPKRAQPFDPREERHG